jgi:hypothetical protein
MQDTVAEYKKNINTRTWKDLYIDLKKYLSAVFHRKTAMERYQEDKHHDRPTRVRSWS